MDLRKVLRQKRAELQRLERVVHVLEQALAVMEGGYPALIGVPKRGRPVGTANGTGVSPESVVGQAIALIEREGCPLHVNDLLEQLRRQGIDARKQSLTSTLTKMSKAHRTVYKAAPATFGLLRWAAATTGNGAIKESDMHA